MLTALVLVCAIGQANLAACDQTNANDVLVVSERFSNPIACLMHGQAYLAAISVGDFDRRLYQPKIICLRAEAAALARTHNGFQAD